MDPIFGSINLHIASFLKDVREWVQQEERLAPASFHEAALFVLCCASVSAFNRTLVLGGSVAYTRPEHTRRPAAAGDSGIVPILRCSVSRIAAALVELLNRPPSSSPDWAGQESWVMMHLGQQRAQILCCAYDRVRDQVCGAKAVSAGPTYVYCQHHSSLYEPRKSEASTTTTTFSEQDEDWSDSLF